MLIRSTSSWAVLLLACKIPLGEHGEGSAGNYVYKFPLDRKGPPGLLTKVDQTKAVFPQLAQRVEEFFARKSLVQYLEFVENYVDTVKSKPELGQVQLFVANWKPIVTKDDAKDWVTMPQILRDLGPGKERLTYLRAFQVLQGGLSETTDVVDTKDLLN